MRLLATALLFTSVLLAQEADHPLTSLPYTPSLDVPSMDRSVQPCQNFYLYSCGTWIKNNPIPPDQARWSVYSKLTLENQRFLWGILQQAAQPSPSRSKVEAQIGDYFAACMDDGSREKAGASPLRSTGSWPGLD